jgi:enoyl-[acyl-carrier protein] reductase III
VQADVGKPGDVRALFDRIRERGGSLDGIVHSAALGRFQPMLEVRPIEWDAAMRVNAHAMLLLVREALGLLREPGSSIVALSSLGAQRYVPFYGAIGASKAALESVVRSLAVELGPRGIRVNVVAGGLIEGETLEQFPQSQLLRDAVAQRTPANRLGRPEDIADVVVFLLSDGARWINGQTLVVDGGFSLV